MRSRAPAALLCLVGMVWGCAAAAAQEPGTTGLRLIQLYDDTQANKRGNLVVVDVWARTPGAAAGVQKGDVVLAIDGSPVVGKDALAAFKSELRGPAGGKVRLSLVRVAEDNRQLEVTLERSAYPLRENPAAQPFSFSMPRSWRFEGFEFPLPWSPQLAYHVEARACADAGHTALLFNLSPQPLGAPIWSKMEAIRSTFRCRRAP